VGGEAGLVTEAAAIGLSQAPVELHDTALTQIQGAPLCFM
jgi:hypothetical protein